MEEFAALFASRRFEEAEAWCRRALERDPGAAGVHINLGNVLTTLGRLVEAEASYRRALELKPEFVEAHSNLGNLLNLLGRVKEAEASCRRALALRPDFHSAFTNLGNSLQAQNRAAEAEASFRRALHFTPDDPALLANLAGLLHGMGRLEDAEGAYRRVLELQAGRPGAPGFLVGALNGHAHALARLVPDWHVPMMNDAVRNDAYHAALRSAVTPATTVLEIGTGSGLLAMMAAKLGARDVVTCESVPLIAATASKIVAANGLAAKVRVVGKKSAELAIGADLPRPADVLVSEIFSSELLSEGVLPSLEDAKRRLLAPGARLIPAAGSVMCALFGGEEARRNIEVGEVCGFDLSGFNAISSRKRYLHRGDLAIELLSEDAEALSFDFTARDYFPAEERTLRLRIRRAGRCHGVVQWLRLQMDERVRFENHPAVRNDASGWQQCLYRFDQPVDVVPGQQAVVRAAHNRQTLWFFLERIET